MIDFPPQPLSQNPSIGFIREDQSIAQGQPSPNAGSIELDRKFESAPIAISGTSSTDNPVMLELYIIQTQPSYLGRFSHMGKPLKLTVRTIETERSSGGVSRNVSMVEVEALNLDELVQQVGGVERLSDLVLVPAKTGTNLWNFALADNRFSRITVDLRSTQVIYDADQP